MRQIGWTKTIVAIALSCSLTLVHADDSGSRDGSGEDIYDSYCGGCHGFGGSAPLPNTPNLAAGERLEKTDSTLLEAIRKGRGSMMPAWAGILNEAQCMEILRYIRATSKLAKRSVSSS